jgi:hypothetical protein
MCSLFCRYVKPRVDCTADIAHLRAPAKVLVIGYVSSGVKKSLVTRKKTGLASPPAFARERWLLQAGVNALPLPARK